MNHGTLTAYISHGCRCDECRTHRNRWQKRYMVTVYGRGQRVTVPVDRAAAHLRALLDSGLTPWDITIAGGWKSRNAWLRLLNGDTGRIHRSTEARVLAIRSTSPTRPHAYIPAGRARDQLRALARRGWDSRALAARTPLGKDNICDIRSGARTTIRVRTQTAVDDLFAELWDSVGPSVRTARRAERDGWPAPLDLDAPTPDSDSQCLTCVDLLHLAHTGESIRIAAERLGFTAYQSARDHLTRHQQPIPHQWKATA